jgi:hypothetical protein
MNVLTFTDVFRAKIQDDPIPFVESFYLTNTVMHASTHPSGGNSLRCRFWGMPMTSRGETAALQLLNNDDGSVHNFRLDMCGGRFLSFTKDVRTKSGLCAFAVCVTLGFNLFCSFLFVLYREIIFAREGTVRPTRYCPCIVTSTTFCRGTSMQTVLPTWIV